MDESISPIQERLREESSRASYPYEKPKIAERYKDTSLKIHKDNRLLHKGSFLSFGSRRVSLVSSYGNTPTFMRRSMSSSGALEFAVEQNSSFRRPPKRLLPAIVDKKSMPASITESPHESPTTVDRQIKPLSPDSPPMRASRKKRGLKNNLSHSKNFHHYDINVNRSKSCSNRLDSEEEEEFSKMERSSAQFSPLNVNTAVANDSPPWNLIPLLNSTDKLNARDHLIRSLRENASTAAQSGDNASAFPAISAHNTPKDSNGCLNNRDVPRAIILPAESISSSRCEIRSTIPSPDIFPILPYSPIVSKPERYSNESKHRHRGIPALIPVTKGPVDSAFINASPSMRKFFSDPNRPPLDYPSSHLSELKSILVARETIKLLERTVGENLHTTEGMIKSIPFVGDVSDRRSASGNDHLVYTNSSKLCVVM